MLLSLIARGFLTLLIRHWVRPARRCVACDDSMPVGSALRCGRCELEAALRSVGPYTVVEA